MRAFIVAEGTTALIIEDGKEWYSDNFRKYVTRKENMFFREDIQVDPVGKLGTHQGHQRTIGGVYAKAGYYGFGRDGWVLLVKMGDVEVR